VIDYPEAGMKRIIRDLAAETNSLPAKAADQLDEIIHNVHRRLREGKPAHLPGLGLFVPGPEVQFKFEKADDSKSTRNPSRKPTGGATRSRR
jgi:hypothetical protein